MENAKIAIITTSIRRKLSVAGVKAQVYSLLGRLEGLGEGASVAARRRNDAIQLERQWGRERRAHAISVRQGKNIIRRGFFKLD